MKKALVLTSCITFLLGSTALAAPITDFDKSQTLLDLGFINSELETSDSDGSTDFDSKTNFDLGITKALSDKVALQYKYQKAKSDDILDVDADIQQFNVIYKLNNNANAFVGLNRLAGDVSALGYKADLDTMTKFQIGITGHQAFTDKLTGWATIAGGNDNNSYEIGLSNKLSNNADLNIFYRYTKFSDVEFDDVSGYDFDAKVKGFGFGVTVKL